MKGAGRILRAILPVLLLAGSASVATAPPAAAASKPAMIAFTDVYNGIFLMQAGAPHSERLIYPVDDTYSPVWSPDGEHLAFAASSLVGSEAEWDVIEANRDGSHQHVLLKSHGDKDIRSLAWSPDGKKIAYTCNAVAKGPHNDYFEQLCILDLASGHTSMVTDPSGDYGFFPTQWGYQRLSWNPAGTEVAGTLGHHVACPVGSGGTYCWNREIGVVNVHTGAYSTLQTGGFAPDFSPDGLHIVFFNPMPQQGPTGIVVMGAGGAGAHSIVPLSEIYGSAAHEDGEPIYSPNGKDILYAAYAPGHNGRAQLFVIKADGTGDSTQWSDHVEDVHNAAWTPILTTCTVPDLKGDKLAKAKTALQSAACSLGTVSGPTKNRGSLVVVSQSRKPKTDLPSGTKINITLG